jgi:peptide/nickel transport system ATP-binding protein
VELGSVDVLFSPPYHPYTELLLSVVPEPDPDRRRARIIVEGNQPNRSVTSKGCPFQSRCPRKVGAVCEETPPPMQQGGSGHRIACHISLSELLRLQTAGPPTGRVGVGTPN